MCVPHPNAGALKRFVDCGVISFETLPDLHERASLVVEDRRSSEFRLSRTGVADLDTGLTEDLDDASFAQAEERADRLRRSAGLVLGHDSSHRFAVEPFVQLVHTRRLWMIDGSSGFYVKCD